MATRDYLSSTISAIMATFNATTSSNLVELSNPDAVMEVLNQYTLGGANSEVTDDGELTFHGYGWMSADKLDEHDRLLEGYEMVDLLAEIAPHLRKGETLDIQMVGNEKTRFPLAAARYTVTDGEVKMFTLEDGGKVLEPNQEIKSQPQA